MCAPWACATPRPGQTHRSAPTLSEGVSPSESRNRGRDALAPRHGHAMPCLYDFTGGENRIGRDEEVYATPRFPRRSAGLTRRATNAAPSPQPLSRKGRGAMVFPPPLRGRVPRRGRRGGGVRRRAAAYSNHPRPSVGAHLCVRPGPAQHLGQGGHTGPPLRFWAGGDYGVMRARAGGCKKKLKKF
jgi:hypothetical protein